MKTIIKTEKAPGAIGPYSQAVVYNGILYTSGQICINPETGNLEDESIETEAYQVMKNLDALLKEANTSFSSVLKTTIFLKDMNDFTIVSEIYASYFKNTDYPARETVQVSVLPKNVRLEISMIASV